MKLDTVYVMEVNTYHYGQSLETVEDLVDHEGEYLIYSELPTPEQALKDSGFEIKGQYVEVYQARSARIGVDCRRREYWCDDVDCCTGNYGSPELAGWVDNSGEWFDPQDLYAYDEEGEQHPYDLAF